MDLLNASRRASAVRVPAVFEVGNAFRPLGDTFVAHGFVYPPLVFCAGLVLLFSKERGRRPGRFDRTRPWGVLCCYVVLLLSAVDALFLPALVLNGIGAVFVSVPLHYQPSVTRALIEVGATYLRYGPHPTDTTNSVRVAFASAAVLLACVPLLEALRGSGLKRGAAVLVGPLALFAVIHLAQLAWHVLGLSGPTSRDVLGYGVYFRPEMLVRPVIDLRAGWGVSWSAAITAFVEAVKWGTVLAIAIRLCAARLVARKAVGIAPPP
jgi:hypothetical protein